MESNSGAPSVAQAHAQPVVVAMPTLGAVGWLGDGQQACQFWSSPVALGDGEQEEKEAAVVVADAGADAGAAAPEVAEEVAGEAAEGEGEEDEWTPRSTIAEQTLSEDELAGNQAYVPSHTHTQRHVHPHFIAMTAF